MKTIAQLTEDLAKIHCLFQYDPNSQLPLAQLFEPAFVARMVDVTGQNPAPQAGWQAQVNRDSSGKIVSVSFLPPPAPAPAELLPRLRQALNAYLNQHYNQDSRVWLLWLFISEAPTAADKAQIAQVFSWISSVMAYYKTLMTEIQAGKSWNELQVNFAQFDATDPKVAL